MKPSLFLVIIMGNGFIDEAKELQMKIDILHKNIDSFEEDHTMQKSSLEKCKNLNMKLTWINKLECCKFHLAHF